MCSKLKERSFDCCIRISMTQQPPHYRGFSITLRHTTLGRVSSRRVISPTQRPLPDNTQHSQKTDINAPARFEPAIPKIERPQTHALDRAATPAYIYRNKIRKKICVLVWSTECSNRHDFAVCYALCCTLTSSQRNNMSRLTVSVNTRKQ
jgi:hypothetical protein